MREETRIFAVLVPRNAEGVESRKWPSREESLNLGRLLTDRRV